MEDKNILRTVTEAGLSDARNLRNLAALCDPAV
jgi:hypothetical protein